MTSPHSKFAIANGYMKTNLPVEQIKRLVQANWDLQMGSYLSELIHLEGAIYNLGGLIKDYHWNCAGMINTSTDKMKTLIESVAETAKLQGLEPAFYIDPTTKPDSFPQYLDKNGFKPYDDEIWMHCNSIDNLRCRNVDLSIKEVKSRGEMLAFIELFNEAFEMLEDGETSSEYSDSLLQAYDNPPKAVEVKHFIGSSAESMVGIASIYMKGQYATLYNVAVLSNFRKKGFGRVLIANAVKKGFDRGISTVILQTELDGDAHGLYSRLGFENSFAGTIWVQSE